MNFIENFQNHSNSELLKIIDNPQDYQPLAVEAAKTVLASRQLNEEDWVKMKNDLEEQQKEIELQNQNKKVMEDKSVSNAIIDTINPIQTTPRSAEKTILIICIVLGIIALIKIYSEYEMIKYMLETDDARWDFSMFLYFVPVVLLPVSTLLFWKRIKAGWWILSVYLGYVAIGAIFALIWSIFVRPYAFNILDYSILMPWSIIFNGGLLWVICKENIRNIYTIAKRNILISIGISVVLTAIRMVEIFL